MHLHLPKPLHGWREFMGEVGIIVIGVLIALGAEQMVETLHWREGVSQMRGAMRAELAADRARLQINLAQDPCIRVRLQQILRWLDSAPESARVLDASGPSLWNYHSSAWDINKASPIAPHFSLEEQLMYAGAYDSVVNEERYLLGEQRTWDQIIAGLASANRPANRDQLALEVSVAKLQLTSREQNSRFFLRHLNDLGIAADPHGAPKVIDVHQLCRSLQD